MDEGTVWGSALIAETCSGMFGTTGYIAGRSAFLVCGAGNGGNIWCANGRQGFAHTVRSE